jgi:hypothetical protein
MIWLLLLLGCAPQDPCEVQRDLSGQPTVLELSAAHPGWQRQTCLQCHPVRTFHTRD